MRVVLFARQFGRDMADGLKSVAWQICYDSRTKLLLLLSALLISLVALLTVLNR